MSNTLGDLMEKNLIEVFGQRDSARREVAIAGIYTADCTFFEAEEQIVGRDALNDAQYVRFQGKADTPCSLANVH